MASFFERAYPIVDKAQRLIAKLPERYHYTLYHVVGIPAWEVLNQLGWVAGAEVAYAITEPYESEEESLVSYVEHLREVRIDVLPFCCKQPS